MTVLESSPHLHRVRPVASSSPSSEALRQMEAEGVPYLPVAHPDGTLAGIVLRRGLENGCRRMRHGALCAVHVHLKPEVDVVSEARFSDLKEEGRIAPAVVVNGDGQAVGIVLEVGAEAEGGQS